MINPNKNYKVKPLGTIVHIDAADAYIPYLKVTLDNGNTVEGPLKRCHTQWDKLKVGDRVAITMQFSIVLDKFMLSTVVRKRQPKIESKYTNSFGDLIITYSDGSTDIRQEGNWL